MECSIINILYQKLKKCVNQKYQKINTNDNNDINDNNINDSSCDNVELSELTYENAENNELNNEDIKKREIILNKINFFCKNNKFFLDTEKVKIYENDIFYKISRIKNNTEKIYEENKNKLKQFCDKNEKNLLTKKANGNREINLILKKYFLNCIYLKSDCIYRCKKCNEEIYVFEKLCYECGKIYFDKCKNDDHYVKNSVLPPMKKYNNNFIFHIQKCLLSSKDIINEIYSSL